MPTRRRPPARTSKLVQRDGSLALTFVNTAASDRKPLCDYADLLAWSRQHRALNPTEAAHLEGLAADRAAARAAFTVAEDLHALLWDIFNAVADREEPAELAVEALNSYLVHVVPPQRLVPAKVGFRLDRTIDREDDLERPLWHVAVSAAGLLASKLCGRIRRCSGPGCEILFVAHNPGRPRKWCDMKSCGSRAKSKRHYHLKTKPYRQEVARMVEERIRRRWAAERLRKRRETEDP